MKRTAVLSFIIITILSSCGVDLPKEVAIEYDNLPQELDFNVDVKPILSDKCYACHGPDKGKIVAGLQLHEANTAYAELPESPGKFAIVPSNLKNSEFYHRIMSEDPEVIMPPTTFNVPLSAKEKAVLIKWIEDGAKYQPHWAFKPLEPEKVPNIKNDKWANNDIDNFIVSRLEKEGLTPNKEADKEALLRRVSLDLTGLPPTIEEIHAFKKDNSKGAYEKQVERLLASPHYGEKMATDWMDVARFADTHGYQTDRARDMSPWRDWVIKSFNSNLSYDKFITYQLAGDLLSNPTKEQILATTFNRLHPQNAEGGIVDEEFRVEYVADRTAVVGQGMMGLTLACARCHDHKYDPISQKNYYELFSFFNNVNETGQISWDEGDIPVPTLMLPTEEEKKVIEFLNKNIAKSTKSQEAVAKSEKSDIEKWITASRYKAIGNTLHKGKVAHFKLDNNLKSSIGNKVGKMGRQFSKKEVPNFTKGKSGKGLLMDGDAWLDLKPVGVYKRSDSFSIGLWVNVPKELKEGIFFHKNKAVMLHSMKGYSLYLKDNKLEVVMAHTYPDNAIIERSIAEIPKDKWIHLAMTYNGSSKASGVKIFLDGKELATTVENDNLYKEIIFHDYEDVIYREPIEPGLKVGARWRGIGIKGASVDDIVVYNRALTELEVMQLGNATEAKSFLATAPSQLSSKQKEILSNYYLNHLSQTYKTARKNLAEQYTKLAVEMDDIQEVMVMKEMKEPRQAYILERGQYDVHGDSVFPNTPEFLLPFDKNLPKNRLGLAKWLTDPKHPLTARVAVNRYWQNYFGRGIVKTTEDFGNQGEIPSHPRLINWLAMEFINSGWDIKALQKMIVMSATYRQSSLCSEELRTKDTENILLARGPKLRLSSEMMRDNILTASGLINKKIGGKSVKPYQPAGLWEMNKQTYVPSTGDDLYRRTLYTFWKRTIPHPTLSTFDQPERSECSVRRQKTNTPLQALVLLNDPIFIEASRKIGEEITKADSAEKGIKTAFLSLTGRAIMEKELSVLLRLQKREYEKFLAKEGRAKGWLNAGEYQIDTSLDANLVAANAIVASAIINSDATITKR